MAMMRVFLRMAAQVPRMALLTDTAALNPAAHCRLLAVWRRVPVASRRAGPGRGLLSKKCCSFSSD